MVLCMYSYMHTLVSIIHESIVVIAYTNELKLFTFLVVLLVEVHLNIISTTFTLRKIPKFQNHKMLKCFIRSLFFSLLYYQLL